MNQATIHLTNWKTVSVVSSQMGGPKNNLPTKLNCMEFEGNFSWISQPSQSESRRDFLDRSSSHLSVNSFLVGFNSWQWSACSRQITQVSSFRTCRTVPTCCCFPSHNCVSKWHTQFVPLKFLHTSKLAASPHLEVTCSKPSMAFSIYQFSGRVTRVNDPSIGRWANPIKPWKSSRNSLQWHIPNNQHLSWKETFFTHFSWIPGFSILLLKQKNK